MKIHIQENTSAPILNKHKKADAVKHRLQFVDKHGYLRTTNGRPYIYTRKIAVCRGRRTPRVLPLGVLDVPLI